ncbi:hypothetical protein FB45DRAFT_953414 [Roridomyces roridus]|uniref:F-box domain-containing protein n=1 Tax=Roridomyces roridus TaxID=1738132 RepID=A0AAD7AZ87_9AGAR|nr:hypothetical protein FB45DRAFT_953414 [Roridomyces roridus]
MLSSRCSECGSVKSSFFDKTPISSRHQMLSTTNEPPEDAELAVLRDSASTTNARLAVLEEGIAELRERLKQLQSEKSALNALQEENTAILSPIRRVPPEILAEIFSWTLPGPHEAFALAGEKAKHSPWILGHICGRWRAIALSVPSLWSLIHVAGRTSVDPLPMLRTQVARARALKIHFVGFEPDSDSDSDDDDSNESRSTTQLELFDFLAEHSTRWEELNIVITSFMVPHFAALCGRLPSLKRLWIQWAREDMQNQDTVDVTRCFQTACSLVDVGVFKDGPHTMLPLLPAQQITSYRVDTSWEIHVPVLKLAPNIVEARIFVLDYSELDSWPDASIELPHLQRLYTSFHKVLDFIRAPALTEIALTMETVDDPQDTLSNFFARSSCTPRRLCVEGTPVPGVTAEMLNKHPCITSLTLLIDEDNSVDESVDIFNRHLTMLTVDDVGPVVSPHLHEIRFGVVGPTFPNDSDYSLFIKMLQSRRAPGSSCALADVLFLTYDSPTFDSATLSAMDALREDGLNLVVRSGNTAEVRWAIKRFVYRVPWIY